MQSSFLAFILMFHSERGSIPSVLQSSIRVVNESKRNGKATVDIRKKMWQI